MKKTKTDLKPVVQRLTLLQMTVAVGGSLAGGKSTSNFAADSGVGKSSNTY